ncbi:MAG: signal peptide peptidase SppA [Candidatus Sericytochromatia bacterium]
MQTSTAISQILSASLILTLSLTLSTAPVLAEEATRLFSDTHSVPLPAIALVDDSTALPLNPGAAGAKDLFEFSISKSIDPTVRGHVSAFVGLPNLSLGFQQFQADILGDLRKFSLGYSYSVSDFISFGVGYSLTQQVSVADSNIHSFDAGILLRPARFLSFGLAARNINTPIVGTHQIKRSYVAGVGVRPLGERLTLTADVQWDEGDPVQDISALFGFETEPLDGILLRGGVDLKGQFTLGAGMQFEVLNAGYYHSFNGTRNYDGLHAQVTNAIFESAIRQIGNHFAYIDLSRGFVPDSGQPGPSFLNQGGPPTYWQILQQIKLVKTMPRYKGVIVDVGALGVGLGLIEELRQAIQELRQSGKQVVVYLNQGGMAEYYLATAADQIVLHPLGGLNLNGFAYVLPYYRQLLDLVGVGVDFIKVGRYKTGMESYTQEQASEATIEQYSALQQDDFQRFATALESRRQIGADVFARIMDKTIFTAQESKEVKLVDQVAYRDQLSEIAANLIHQPSVSVEGIERVRMHRESWEPRDKIAVVYVSGAITESASGRDFLFGEQSSGSRTIVEQIYRAKQDAQIKAIVLRVNSPGGSALGSDEIYRALMRYKETTGKPVIVSMGDMAASGGYWIALAGDMILANPSTVTGSIGIFAGKVEFSRLYDKLGINNVVIKTNEKADQNGQHRPFSEAEKQLIQNNLRDFYRMFLERVSLGRKLDIQQVEQVAQGRVYTGAQAEKIKLIDQIGNLDDAIRIAREKSEIKTEDVEIVHLPAITPLLEDLGGLQLLSRTGLLGGIEASIHRLLPNELAILAVIDPELAHSVPGANPAAEK